MQSWFSFAIFCGNTFQVLAPVSRNPLLHSRDTAGTPQKRGCVFSSSQIPQKHQLNHHTESATFKAGVKNGYFHLTPEHLSLKCGRQRSPSPATQAHHVCLEVPTMTSAGVPCSFEHPPLHHQLTWDLWCLSCWCGNHLSHPYFFRRV